MAFDGEAFARSITTAAKSHIDRSLAPLFERLAKLEAQQPARGEKGEAGERGLPGEKGADGVGAADALIDRDGTLVLTFTDGRSKNLGVVVGHDGKDGEPGAAGEKGATGDRGEKGDAGEAGPAGRDGAPGRDGVDGKDAAPVTREMILDAVASDPNIIADAVAAAIAKHFETNPIPVPKDGKDGRDGVDGKDGERGPAGEKGDPGDRGLQGERGEKGADGRDGKDGLSVVKFLIDQSGELVGTFNDGSVERLGPVKGADGRDGVNGKDGVNGSDGRDGRDGVDGLGFDDMEVEYDGEKTVTLVYRRGDVMKEARITIPAVIFRGYWSEGSEHTAGDMVSWAGQVYVAKETTTAKPDDDKAWTLAVKRGRDGRDFTPKEPEGKKQVKIG